MHPRTTTRNGILATAALLAVICLKGPAVADSRTEVLAAVQDMNRWLGPGANGDQWREVLLTDALAGELKKGAQADPAVLAAVYDRFASVAGKPGTYPIERVRLALADWLIEQSEAPLADLPRLAREAKDQAGATDADQGGRVRRRLRGALRRLGARLRSAGPNGENWRQYLRHEELAEQLAAEQPDPAKLQDIYERYVGKYPGLEMSPFVDVRSALADYVAQANLESAGEGASETFNSQLDYLASLLESAIESPAPREVDEIGVTVTELEKYGRAPRVVWAVRSHYAQPNLHLHASKTFLVSALSRDVDDVAPVRDMILGTDIHGTGRTVGRSEIVPVPSRDEATFRILLSGKTYSDTVGYNGPVQIYSNGTTDIFGEKKLMVRSNGLIAGPSRAEATTHTDIRGIGTRRHGLIGKIILKAANKRAYQSKAQAERIASRHAEARIRSRMDGEANERVAEANRLYHDKFLAPLVRYDVYPERLLYSTTDSGLNVTGVVRAADRLAANSAAPAVPVEADLAFSIHESAINNLARSILLGETITQERAIEIYRNMRDPRERDDPLPPEVAIDPQSGPWAVTLASDADAAPQEGDDLPREYGPVTVRIDDGKIRATVHGVRYEVGGNLHETPMDITAIYRLEQGPEGWRFVREGDPTVFPPGRDPSKQGTLSVRETTLRNEMQKRFLEKKTFPETIEIDRRVLQGELAKAGELHVTQAVADNGWLMIAWQTPTPARKLALKVDMPRP